MKIFFQNFYTIINIPFMPVYYNYYCISFLALVIQSTDSYANTTSIKALLLFAGTHYYSEFGGL